MKPISKAFTLVELLIGIVLFALMALAVGSINVFSFYSVFNSAKKSKVQSEISYLVEHITKELLKAEGHSDEVPIEINTVGNTRFYTIYQNITFPRGRDNNDPHVVYTYNTANHIIDFRDINGVNQQLSNMVTDIALTNTPSGVFREFASLTLTVCYAPDGVGGRVCGDTENPSVTVITNINMPQVTAQ